MDPNEPLSKGADGVSFDPGMSKFTEYRGEMQLVG
jgi:hypothetical protein